MNYAVILGVFVGSLIGNLLALYLSRRKNKKKDGGCCTVCKYYAMTPMRVWKDENGNVEVDENSGYVCTNKKSGYKNTASEFRCKYFRWCYK